MKTNTVAYPIIACARMPISNGGEVVMTAPPATNFEDAVWNLKQTHDLYIEYGGWGGARSVDEPVPFEEKQGT